MTPSPPAQAEASETVEQIAERLLPCFNVMRVCDACVEKHTGRQIHSPMCPASYRPAVVVALKSERKRADIAETALVDATRNLLSDAQSERDSRDRLRRACEIALGYLTGGMDGDWTEDDPVEILRSALTPGEKS